MSKPMKLSWSRVAVELNGRTTVLSDATWEQYPEDHPYNLHGDNGFLTGLCVQAPSGVFHREGEQVRFDYMCLANLWSGQRRSDGVVVPPIFRCNLCG